MVIVVDCTINIKTEHHNPGEALPQPTLTSLHLSVLNDIIHLFANLCKFVSSFSNITASLFDLINRLIFVWSANVLISLNRPQSKSLI